MFEILFNYYYILSYFSVNVFRFVENSIRQLVWTFPNVFPTFTNPFVIHMFICQPEVDFFNHSEELQTMLFEVELIINKSPLIYVYPNTIETCLTNSYLLFGRQLV